MTNSANYHIPVMLDKCIEALNINPDGTYVDVTFGGGGHSRKIFEKLSNKGHLIAFDQDPDAKANAWEAPNFTFIASNFSFIKNHLRMLGVTQVDGILADLGVSSHQFDEDDRGFSIRGNAPLDMRMNQEGEKDAFAVINEYEDSELIKILRFYGEVNNAPRLVREIIKERSRQPIKTTRELRSISEKCAPRGKEHKYLAQVFQAIRIEVNEEMDVLEKLLNACADVLKPGGRLVVMSYHSLEDRMVKNFLKRGSISGEIEKDFFGNVLKPFTEVSRKPITADEIELEQNNRARSAKLRIAERNE